MIPEPLPTDLVARSWPGESSSADAASFNGCVSRLDHVDLSLSLSRDQEEVRLAAAQKRLLHLRLVLAGLIGDGAVGPPVCVVFEAWDASGKGGAIKRLVGRLDPRHVRVAQFAAPTHDAKRHHFLARFYPQLPGWGGMAVISGREDLRPCRPPVRGPMVEA